MILSGGIVELNGCKLSVNSNLIQNKNLIKIQNGRLDVFGDYKMMPMGYNSGSSLLMEDEE